MLLLLSLAQAAVSVPGDPVLELAVETGRGADRVIVVENDGPAPLRATVYFEDPGSEASSRPWMRFTPREVTVPPGEAAHVPFRVEVPADAGLGTFEAVYVVEEAPAEAVWPPPADAPPAEPLRSERRTVRVMTLVDERAAVLEEPPAR
ncbi:MAG: hypothetical protein ACK4YP_03150 [Myxococcota bacterium]